MSCSELYRYFDENGELLYVGISINSVSRACQHKQGSHWYSDAAWIEIERFASRKQAVEAERKAIAYERPKHNIRDVPAPKKKARPRPAPLPEYETSEAHASEPAHAQKVWLSDREIASQYGVTRITVWRWAREGNIPKPKKLGPNTTRWSAAEIDQHQNRILEEA